MKILVVTTLYPNVVNPHRAVFVRQFCEQLADHAEIRIMAPVPYSPPWAWLTRWNDFRKIPYREETANGQVVHPRYFIVPKVEFLTGVLYFCSVFFDVLRLRKQFDFDLINVHWAYPDGFAMALMGKLLHVPVIVTAHGSDIYSYRNFSTVRPLLRWALGHVRAVIAVSNALRSAILEMVPSQRLDVIPCAAVNPQLFRIMDQKYCRRYLNMTDSSTLILYIGNLVPIKGVKYLIDAFAKTKANPLGRDFRLAIVGDGPERLELEHLADFHGIRESVSFVGKISHQEIPLWMNSADIICLPSLSEGMPNVAVEALACGKPVVATNVGGLPDIILNGRTGFLVPPKDSDKLSGALIEASHRQWSDILNNETIVQNTWDDIVIRFMEVANDIMESPNSHCDDIL